MRPAERRATARPEEPKLFDLEPVPPPAKLEVDCLYEAVGPVDGKWERQRAKVVGFNDRGYVTQAPRQVASMIAFGCERFWRKVQE